uniref:Uncharacterized protein n=1 Tax=Hyaloperonospora arabidopsidis (strain Emoy2) TaxID=559515 RepID=M4BM26_HYAAE
MATTAYQSWLRKSEFKVPHQLSTSSSNSPSVTEVSTHLATETTFQTAALSPTSKKRPKLISIHHRNEKAADAKRVAYVAAGHGDHPVETQPNLDKVAAWKQHGDGKERLMKQIVPRQTSALNALRRLSTKKEKRSQQWSQCVDVKTSCDAVKKGTERRVSIRTESGTMHLKQMDTRNRTAEDVYNSTRKRLRSDVETSGSGDDGGIGFTDEHLQRSLHDEDVVGMPEFVGSDNDDATTRRLSYCSDHEEEEKSTRSSSGLPPKRPVVKQKGVETSVLDECQYWMAVDRFSHLE